MAKGGKVSNSKKIKKADKSADASKKKSPAKSKQYNNLSNTL